VAVQLYSSFGFHLCFLRRTVLEFIECPLLMLPGTANATTFTITSKVLLLSRVLACLSAEQFSYVVNQLHRPVSAVYCPVATTPLLLL